MRPSCVTEILTDNWSQSLSKYDYHAQNFEESQATHRVVDDVAKHISASQERRLENKFISEIRKQIVTIPLLVPTKLWWLTSDRCISCTFVGSSQDELQE